MTSKRDDLTIPSTPETTRRQFLEVTAGSFALAACGLFLPTVAEPAAGKGAAGGRLGGRRGRNRRGRQHGRRKDKRQHNRRNGSKAPGWSLIRYTALRASYIHNDSGVFVDFYFRVKGTLDNFGPLVNANKTAELNSAHADYAPERYAIAAYFHGPSLPTSVYVEVRNGLLITPWATVVTGGTINDRGILVGGTKRITEKPMEEQDPDNYDLHTYILNFGKGIEDREMQLKLSRLPDSDTQIWFNALIKWA